MKYYLLIIIFTVRLLAQSDEVIFEDQFKHIKIGVLAKRGKETTHKRWDVLAEYLSKRLDTHIFSIIALDFKELKKSVQNKSVDFVITNTMYYVQLESKYGISRIATLINSDTTNKYKLKEFGGVIFTRSDNKKINTMNDLDSLKFGAVSPLSFGGWIMAYEELFNYEIYKEDIKLHFLNTHDAVVDAVLSGEVDAGTVRTDTLERMETEGKIDLSAIKVISSKKYENFPYLVSTKLYPEWPIAKLKHASDSLSNKLLSELVSIEYELYKEKKIDHWNVPLDYSSVHSMLKKSRPPAEPEAC